MNLSGDMVSRNYGDIPSLVTKQILPFLLDRLQEEEFMFVESLRETDKDAFKAILKDVFSGSAAIEEGMKRTRTQTSPPGGYKKVKGWNERLFRTEFSKIFTLGYGDYLLSEGETECYIPANGFDDESEECKRLIVEQQFPILAIQDSFYSNYGRSTYDFPTVPLHPDCRHIITRISRQN